MLRVRIAVVSLVVALLAFVSPAGARDVDADTGTVGSWLVAVSLEGGPSFTNLATYTSDGIITSHNLPAVALGPTAPVDNLYLPPGVGAWEPNDNGGVTATIVLMYGDIEGTLLSVETVTWDVTVDESGNSYSGEATYIATLLTGETIYSGTARLDGERITVLEHGEPVTLPGFGTPAATPAG